MNRRSFLTVVVVSLLCLPQFTSCSDDDDDEEQTNNNTQISNVNSADTISVSVSGQIGSYSYVDLGLPSGTKWATYNVGASKPNECSYGFEWSASDDAATSNWGSSWRTPTKTEYEELVEGCDWTFLTNGNLLGTSKVNGNTILFYARPSTGEVTYGYSVSGHIDITKPNYASIFPGGEYYWTSTVDEDNSSKAYCFHIYEFYHDNMIIFETEERDYHWSVRAVVNE